MSGLDMDYEFGDTNSAPYSAWLQSVTSSSIVLTSIDLEPACSEVAASWVETTQAATFDYRLEAVSPSQVQATAVADGVESRIVTAVTFDDASGNAILVSYGWQGDTTAAYEARSLIVTPQNVGTAANTLAGEGYFISAFGGNDMDGYILIGMRVQGDTLPRPIRVGDTPPANPDAAYYTPVAILYEPGSSLTISEQ
jgi:hypothetical protein